MLRGSFFVGLLWVFARLTAAVNFETMCHEHPYGTLLPNPRDCSSYYVCQSGPELAYCDRGLHFDRTYKVCNWPHWADCRIEEVEFLEHPNQSHTIEKLPKGDSNDPVEKQVENSEENQTLHDNNSLDESSTLEDIHKPIHVHLPNYEGFDSNEVASHEIPNPEENESEIPVDAPVEDLDEEVEELENHTNALEIPVAKPADDVAINDSEIKNSEKVEVQVPVVVPEIEILYPKPVSAEISDNKIDSNIEAQASSTHKVQVSVAVPNDSNKSYLQSQIVQVPVVVPTEVSNSVPEESIADKKGKNQSNEINEVLLPKEKDSSAEMENLNALSSGPQSADIVEKINSVVVKLPVKGITVEIPHNTNGAPVKDLTSEIMGGKVVDTQNPSKNQVIKLPVEASSEGALNAANNVQVVNSKPEITGEKMESQKPLYNQVIKLPVEASPEGALSATNNVQVVDSKPEITGEKKETQKPLYNQVIKLPVEASPEGALSATNNVQVVDSKPEITGEKMESQKPLYNQVIKLPVEASPEGALSATNNVQVVDSKPEITGEKMESQKPLYNQVIKLPVEASPEGALSATNNVQVVDSKPEITGEKKGSQKPLYIQVIKLPVEASPEGALNAANNVQVVDSKSEIAGEKMESQKPLNNQVIELPVGASPEPALSAANNVQVVDSKSEITGEKMESQKPLNNQVIELPVEASSIETLNVANGVLVVDSKPEITGEKMESQQPLNNQVIELPVEASPEGVLNAANGVLVVDSKPEITGEKMQSQKPLNNQVIELPVEASAVEVSNTAKIIPVDDSKPEITGQKAVDSQKPSKNQVIELPVEAFSAESINLASEVDLTPNVAVEKVKSQKTSENSNQVIELLVPYATNDISNAATENRAPQVGSSVGSGNANTPSQVFHLPVPSGAGSRPTNSDKINQNLSSKSEQESVELAEEFNSQSSEENQVLESSSSFEEDIAKKSAESAHLSEENESLPNSIELPNPVDSLNKPEKENPDMSQSSESIQEESSEEVIGNSNTQTNSQQPLASSSEEGSVQVVESAEKEVSLQNPTNFESSEEEEETVEEVEKDEEEETETEEEVEKEEKVEVEDDEEEEEEEVADEEEEEEEEEEKEEQKEDDDEEEEEEKEEEQEKKDKFQASKTPKPNKYITSSAPLEPNGPLKLADKLSNSQNKTFNLIVSMLSVVSGKKDSTINRPIVGAHSIETGHPIETMTGYNTRNVQCIHNGLYFLPHPSSCQKYFICAYHNLHLHSCGDDLVWNFKREQCELKSNSRCYSREAHDAADKPKPINTSTPSKENDIGEITLAFEKATITTRMPPLRTRTTQTSAVTARDDSKGPICPGLRQMYLPSFEDCNKYYICILGEPVLTSCPDNLHWDVKGEFCGHQEVVHCATR